MIKLFTKYVLFLLTFIAVSQANIAPLKSSYDLRSSGYGVRYYDPRTSVWQSPDPILDEYVSGKTNGGVFNPKNLSLFTYTYNNPVNLIDPDGNEVVVLLDKEAAWDQGHSALAVMEKGGQGKVTYLSYGPQKAEKPMQKEFDNRGDFYKFLLDSKYGDKPKKGSGFNYDNGVVFKADEKTDQKIIDAGKKEVSQKRWVLFGNLFGSETSDADVNCKDMTRNSLGEGGIVLPNKMTPNSWQENVVQKAKNPRNKTLESEINLILDIRNSQLKTEK